MTDPNSPAPGWYDDGNGQQRYWDGAQWTEQTAPLPPAAPAAPTPVQASAPEAVPPMPVAGTVQAPPPGMPAPTPSAPHKQRNTLGLIAFIVAVVGFIFACIPGALIIGWILLPIAFILAIVALFMKGQSKALALTGLILSVVGTIVAFVVFFAVVANSFNDAFGGTGSAVIQTDAPKASSADKTDASKDSAAKDDSASGKVGTRENPAAIGSVIKGNDYSVTINSVNLNATDAVQAANEFNDAPDAGTVYALINATVTYNGKDSGSSALVGIAYVTADGNVLHSYDKLVVGPDPILGADELYGGASATGNVVIQIPVAADGLIRVKPGIIADEVFVKTK